MTGKPHGDYHFKTHWRVRARIEDIFEILTQAGNYPKWWGLKYFTAREIVSAGPNGLGQTVEFEMRGWLPYTLRWQLKSVEADKPTHIAGISSGDFSGLGVWTLKQDGPWADITFNWTVIVHKPFLKTWGFLLKSLFMWNHDWVMSRAEKGLNKLVEAQLTR